jgi:hypothetical protein
MVPCASSGLRVRVLRQRTQRYPPTYPAAVSPLLVALPALSKHLVTVPLSTSMQRVQ